MPERLHAMGEHGKDIPARWLRVAAIDLDWKGFGAVWAAIDRTTGIMRIYDEISSDRKELPVHAAALRKRGKWIPILFEPEARKRSREEGIALAQEFVEHGLELYTVDLDTEAGLASLQSRIGTGALKAFDTLVHWPNAYRQYHRQDDGRLPQEGDYLMRATQLIALYGEALAVSENQAKSDAGVSREDLVAEAMRTSSTGY